MKKLILMMTLMTSLSSFAVDALVLCDSGKDVVTAQRNLNTKAFIPLYRGEVLRTNETKMVDVRNYEMTAPTMAIQPDGDVLICVSLNKKK